VGTRVLAVTRFGGYASHLAVPAAQVFPIPAGVATEEAAGFAVVLLTAYYALFELAHPRPGATLLVHSAAGGVGGALCQLGKVAGARVVGVVGSSPKVAEARARGADAVIDRSREDLWTAARRHAPEGYDVVLDAGGPATFRRSYAHLAPAGKLVAYGFGSMLPRGRGRPSLPRLLVQFLMLPRFSPLRLANDNKSVLAFNLSYLFHRRDILAEAMGRLLGWLADGRIRPAAVAPYPLDRVAAAHRDLESGETTGKLVLTFGSV
jgi:NADPH:quinone reductase-like Zn-dependent oxidoreductase